MRQISYEYKNCKWYARSYVLQKTTLKCTKHCTKLSYHCAMYWACYSEYTAEEESLLGGRTLTLTAWMMVLYIFWLQVTLDFPTWKIMFAKLLRTFTILKQFPWDVCNLRMTLRLCWIFVTKLCKSIGYIQLTCMHIGFETMHVVFGW